MAAVNASPTSRGTKTSGPPQHASRQSPHNPSPHPKQEGDHAQLAQPEMEQEITNTPQRIAYQHLAFGQVHLPHSSGSQSVLRRMQVQDPSQNQLTAKALPSEEWFDRKDSEGGRLGTNHEEKYPGKDLEIQHLRTQARSVSVLQELLADSRSEIRALHDVLSEQEMLLNQHGLKVSESVEDKLTRLRLSCSSMLESEWSVELKRPPCSPHERIELSGSHQLAELKRQLSTKDEEIATLYRLLQSSEDEKGREIALLKEQIQNNCEDQQTSEAICRSLSDETEVLKTRIQRLMDECQGLTRELGNWKRQKQSKSAAMSSDTPEGLDQLRLKIEELEWEKSKTSAKLDEVIRMNKRWQKYSRQQDQIKDQLTQTKDQLEKQNKALTLQCREYEDSISQLQRRLQKVEEESRHRRVEETKAAGREASCRRLERRVTELERELERARRNVAKYDGEVVEQQLKLYTEDFQKERTEKERLKRENLILSRNHQEAEDLLTELDRKVNEVERENQELRQRLQRVTATYGYPELDLSRERRARELVPHGGSQRSPIVSLENFPTLPQDVKPDGPASFTPPSSSPRSPPVSPSAVSQSAMSQSTILQSGRSPSYSFTPPLHVSLMTSSISSGFNGRGEDCVDGMGPREASLYRDYDDEPLQCPRCLREFPVSKHSDFMRHMESCLDT